MASVLVDGCHGQAGNANLVIKLEGQQAIGRGGKGDGEHKVMGNADRVEEGFGGGIRDDQVGAEDPREPQITPSLPGRDGEGLQHHAVRKAEEVR